MNTVAAPTHSPFSVDATVDLSPEPPAAEPVRPSCRMKFLAGQPHLSAETQSLLQLRLRAAAWIFLLGFALYCARSFFLPESFPRLRAAKVVVMIALGACLVLLSRGR